MVRTHDNMENDTQYGTLQSLKKYIYIAPNIHILKLVVQVSLTRSVVHDIPSPFYKCKNKSHNYLRVVHIIQARAVNRSVKNYTQMNESANRNYTTTHPLIS